MRDCWLSSQSSAAYSSRSLTVPSSSSGPSEAVAVAASSCRAVASFEARGRGSSQGPGRPAGGRGRSCERCPAPRRRVRAADCAASSVPRWRPSRLNSAGAPRHRRVPWSKGGLPAKQRSLCASRLIPSRLRLIAPADAWRAAVPGTARWHEAWAAARVSVVSPLPCPGVAGKRRFSTFTAGRAAAVSRMSARPRRRLGVGDEIVRRWQN